MRITSHVVLPLVTIALLGGGCAVTPVVTPTTTQTVETRRDFIAPITDATTRVTKKPFGIQITQKTSPVQPERFSGFHTGVDFETTPDEQDTDVLITATCDGPLVVKRWATGYGGVAVQQCNTDEGIVTVVYGHLDLESIRSAVGDVFRQGDRIGILGAGASTETDGERKHLHLGIHRGATVNVLGYVQTEADLGRWIDSLAYFTYDSSIAN